MQRAPYLMLAKPYVASAVQAMLAAQERCNVSNSGLRATVLEFIAYGAHIGPK